jgi:hypothetical protein
LLTIEKSHGWWKLYNDGVFMYNHKTLTEAKESAHRLYGRVHWEGWKGSYKGEIIPLPEVAPEAKGQVIEKITTNHTDGYSPTSVVIHLANGDQVKISSTTVHYDQYSSSPALDIKIQ